MVKSGFKYDWYQASTDRDPQVVCDALLRAFPAADIAPASPRNGYTHAASIKTASHTYATVFYGGNQGVNVLGSGDDSPAVAEVLKEIDWRHRVTRVDSAIDFVEEGLFERMAGQLFKYASAKGIAVNQQGDWLRGEGRTLYLGAPSSTSRIVLYEKGYESGGDKNWVRLELRVRPKGRDSKQAVALCPAESVMNLTAMLRDGCQSVGLHNDAITAQAVGTVWRPSDTQRARMAMIRQYSKVLQAWADENGGFEGLGEQIEAQINDAKHKKGMFEFS